jgi:hypothetical protein
VYIITNRREMRHYLEIRARNVSAQKRALAKNKRDERFYDGIIAGIQEAINGLDCWDKCEPEAPAA